MDTNTEARQAWIKTLKERQGLLNPEFKYVPSHETDIRKTFERVKNETNQKDAK